MKKNQEIAIYRDKRGNVEFRADVQNETIWATQDQIAGLFDTTKQNIGQHLKTIFKTKELDENSVVKKFFTTAADGKQYLTRFYNLDAILSVGYRVNSRQATAFRQWATKTLREHLTKGYTINRLRIAKNYNSFMKAVGDIQTLLPESIILDPKSVLDLIKEFASTWVSLDAYDKEKLETKGVTKRSVKLTSSILTEAIGNLKSELMKKGEASEFFAAERTRDSLEGIVGNTMQTFGGKMLYPTIEEKAAHLLYFIVKNHPFIDGNKRSGAFAFIWFLRKGKSKSARKINPTGLAALTLLIAESNPQHKEKMIALVTQLLR